MASSHNRNLQAQDARVKDGSRVITLPSFDPSQRRDAVVPAGSSVREIVQTALPGATPEVFDWVRVSIGDDIIPRHMWPCVKPKPETVVVVRVVPGNSGTMRAVLSIAVAVSAIALGQLWAAPLALGAGFSAATATAIGSVVTATTLLAGTFLINALIPVRQNQQASVGLPDSPTYSVQGFRNVPNPDGVIPCVMGTTRFAPPYAALPYTETYNGNTYVRALFLVGYGPVNISDIRIGETPIDKFLDIQYEVREGYETDLPVTLYPKQCLEERLSIQLTNNAPYTRFTASDADEVQLDVSFPSGLFWMHTNRDSSTGQATYTGPLGMSIGVGVEYRLENTVPWTTVTWNMSNQTQKAYTETYRFKLPERGRYEVRLTRGTADYDDFNSWDQDNQRVSISYWSAIKSFRPEYPINFNKPLALIAVWVRAGKQLNGVLDSLNCQVSRVCKDWNGSAWVEQATNNPASLYRFALQGPANAYPLTDDEIDLEQLQDWHEFCETEDLKYNRVQDYESSLYDVMGDICAAGRAAPRDDGTKWGVVIDRPQTVTVAHITPRNAWGFSGERPYVIFPQGFRIKFYDETNLYKPAERLVPWPGFVGEPSITESLDLPGVTNPDQVWMEARKRQYELIYRRDSFTVMQDFEGSIARRGDLVQLSYDILDSTQLAARVRSVSGGVVVLDDKVTMEAGKNYALRIRKLATTEIDNDQSILRTVRTTPGTTDALVLTSAGVDPEVGDLVMFGEALQVTQACLVRETEGAEDFNRHLVLIPYAPEIFALLALEEPPEWTGRSGADLGLFYPGLDFHNTSNSQYVAMGFP